MTKDGRLQFNAGNLTELGRGQVGLAINHALRQLVRDIIDRPADKGKRNLTIKVVMTPDLSPSGQLDTIDITCDIKQVVPTRRNARPFKILPMGDGTAIFTPSSPDDPRQLPLMAGGPDDGLEDGESIDKHTGEVMSGRVRELSEGKVDVRLSRSESDESDEAEPDDDEEVSDL